MSSTTTKVSTVRDNLNSTKLGVASDAIVKAPLGDILSILLDTRNANATISAVTATGAITPTATGVTTITATGVSAATAVSPASAAYASPDQSLVAALVNSLKTQVNAAVTDLIAVKAKLDAAVVDISAIATKQNAAVVDISALRSEMATINIAGTIGGATQTGISVTPGTGVAVALAQAPTTNGLITVNATAGTTTGVKTITRNSNRAPQTGEVYWDGGVNLTFAIVDAVTACDVIYAKSDLSQKVSCLLRPTSE
jgi:TusA-related sulfurtransferase